MRIFVTGGGGFVGRHLVPRLRAAGHDVDAPTRREVDLRARDALPGASEYDRIFHLAAWTRAGRFCAERGGDQWVVNQQINTNVLAWWLDHQPQSKLVAFGTSASYAPSPAALAEADYMRGEPSADYYAYAMTKRMLFVGLASLQRQYGLDFLYIVPSTIYGPDYHVDGREPHFIYDLARKIIRGARYGEPVRLWGGGDERRELVYVSDYVDWVLELTDRASSEIVNVGAGQNHTIAEFARILTSVANLPGGSTSIEYDTTRAAGTHSKILATTRLDELLPDRRHTPLDLGLSRTLEWVDSHLEELGRPGDDSALP